MVQTLVNILPLIVETEWRVSAGWGIKVLARIPQVSLLLPLQMTVVVGVGGRLRFRLEEVGAAVGGGCLASQAGSLEVMGTIVFSIIAIMSQLPSCGIVCVAVAVGVGVAVAVAVALSVFLFSPCAACAFSLFF